MSYSFITSTTLDCLILLSITLVAIILLHMHYIDIIAGYDTFTDENYSKLGIQDKDTKINSHLVSQNEEEEIDEEHDYFILEGPESEDQNNTSGYMGAEIMGGATDHEVLVHQKKSKQ